MRRLLTIAVVAILASTGCGKDNGSANKDGGGPQRTNTPTPVERTATPNPTETPTPTPEVTATGLTPTPTVTATPQGPPVVCEGPELFGTLTSEEGSDLDTGWTGVAHDSVAISEAQVVVDLNCNGNDCEVDGSALVGGRFGAPLPLSAGGVSTCVINEFRSAVNGTYNCATGCGSADVELTSFVFLVNDIAKPCPLCEGDDVPNDGVQNGICDSDAINSGQPCDVGGISEVFGPTSLDCLPTGSSVGELAIDLTPLTTGTITVESSVDCATTAFPPGSCYCPMQSRANACTPVGGAAAGVCPDSGVCSSGPFDGICANQRFRSCVDNLDCEGTFPGAGDCVFEARPCFGNTITASGQCATGDPQRGTTVGFFCIPATRTPAINTVAGLPGPGVVSLPGRIERTIRP